MADPPRASFLRRWSRRKADSRAAEVPTPEPAAASAPKPPADLAAPAEEAEEAPDTQGEAPELPPIESLTRESDYTPFLRRGVPDELQRLALRKLWRSDPVLANLDGLNDYDEDYRTTVRPVVSTLYRVGKGMLDPAPGKPVDPGKGFRETAEAQEDSAETADSLRDKRGQEQS